MRDDEHISDGIRLIARLRAAVEVAGDHPAGALWGHIRDCLLFIFTFGQLYRLEDYRTGLEPARDSYVSEALASRAGETSRQTISLLLRTLEELTEPRERRLIIMMLDTLNYIASTGQWDDLEDYLEDFDKGASPAFAYFETRAQAEAWLHGPTEPPSLVTILIGNEYFEAWYSREFNDRQLKRSELVEWTLESFARKGRIAAVASFSTLAEAQEWLEAHPADPSTFVSIAGETYLAIHQRRLKRHTLHHVASTLQAWEEEKRRRAESQESLEAEDSVDETEE